MNIIFDVKHLYYLPQYLPVYCELKQRGVACEFVFYHDSSLDGVMLDVIEQEQLDVYWVDNWQQALDYYLKGKPQWIVFGDVVDNIELIHQRSKTVLMQHGIGPKSCYYDVSKNLTTVRFVEGEHRLNRLLELYPGGKFIDTGYAKLDPIINNSIVQLSLTELGLDPSKPTLLYAPTFYPSSIECFAKEFANDFADYNIILKPHFFSLIKSKYKKQSQLLAHWAQSDNVYLAKVSDYNLLSFMSTADVLVSDASSAIFEFAALNKPVVWCDFHRLRWSYRGIFSYRLRQRLDQDIEFFNQIAERVESYQQLKLAVSLAINEPTVCAKQRREITKKLAGKVDGLCSERICEVLLG